MLQLLACNSLQQLPVVLRIHISHHIIRICHGAPPIRISEAPHKVK